MKDVEKDVIRLQESVKTMDSRIDHIEVVMDRAANDHAAYSKDTDKRIGELALLQANQGLQVGQMMRVLYWLIGFVFTGVGAAVLTLVFKHG
jgi:hypothetical protein